MTTEEIEQLQKRLSELKAQDRKGLTLAQTDKQDLRVGFRKDGKAYSVRTNRDRFFFPKEWTKFYDNLKDNQKMTFDFLINTGARVNEAINVKVEDCFLHERRIILRVTKIKARKGEKTPRPRTISVSSQFARRLKKYIEDNNIKDGESLGLLSKTAAHIAMKTNLQRIGIKDWYMFSIHNIRKTHGNWLKCLGVDGAEICTRLGHDYNTFLTAYGSPDIFTFEERQRMRDVLGDLYQR